MLLYAEEMNQVLDLEKLAHGFDRTVQNKLGARWGQHGIHLVEVTPEGAMDITIDVAKEVAASDPGHPLAHTDFAVWKVPSVEAASRRGGVVAIQSEHDVLIALGCAHVAPQYAAEAASLNLSGLLGNKVVLDLSREEALLVNCGEGGEQYARTYPFNWGDLMDGVRRALLPEPVRWLEEDPEGDLVI